MKSRLLGPLVASRELTMRESNREQRGERGRGEGEREWLRGGRDLRRRRADFMDINGALRLGTLLWNEHSLGADWCVCMCRWSITEAVHLKHFGLMEQAFFLSPWKLSGTEC